MIFLDERANPFKERQIKPGSSLDMLLKVFVEVVAEKGLASMSLADVKDRYDQASTLKHFDSRFLPLYRPEDQHIKSKGRPQKLPLVTKEGIIFLYISFEYYWRVIDRKIQAFDEKLKQDYSVDPENHPYPNPRRMVAAIFAALLHATYDVRETLIDESLVFQIVCSEYWTQALRILADQNPAYISIRNDLAANLLKGSEAGMFTLLPPSSTTLLAHQLITTLQQIAYTSEFPPTGVRARVTKESACLAWINRLILPTPPFTEQDIAVPTEEV